MNIQKKHWKNCNLQNCFTWCTKKEHGGNAHFLSIICKLFNIYCEWTEYRKEAAAKVNYYKYCLI